MKVISVAKKEKQKQLKDDQKAHEAQAKADRLQRKALDNGKKRKLIKPRTKLMKKLRGPSQLAAMTIFSFVHFGVVKYATGFVKTARREFFLDAPRVL